MSVNLASDSGLAAAVGASAIGGRCYVCCCWRGSQQCCTECAHPLRMFLRLRKRGVCLVRGCTKNVRKQLHRRHNLSERKRALFFVLRYCCCFACAQQSHRRDAAAARPKILSQIAAASQRPGTHLSFLSLPSLAGFSTSALTHGAMPKSKSSRFSSDDEPRPGKSYSLPYRRALSALPILLQAHPNAEPTTLLTGLQALV